MDPSRRHFLKRGLLDYLAESCASFGEECKTVSQNREESLDRYFLTDDACQALLADYTLEDLQEDARKAGIDPDGLSKRELAKKLFSKSEELN